MARTAVKSSPKTIARLERLGRIINMRMQGFTLDAIGQAEGVSNVRIYQLLTEGLERSIVEAGAEVRRVELLRLDDLQCSVYERAVAGDDAAIDRCLAIHDRRVRLMGLVPPRPVAAAAFGGE
jgi:hypothetical protein